MIIIDDNNYTNINGNVNKNSNMIPKSNNKKNKVTKMVIVMMLMKIMIITTRIKIIFYKSSPYNNLYKSSGKNRTKCYFRQSSE